MVIPVSSPDKLPDPKGPAFDLASVIRTRGGRKRDSKNYSRLQMVADMCKGGLQPLIGTIAIASSFGLGGIGEFIVGAGVASSIDCFYKSSCTGNA